MSKTGTNIAYGYDSDGKRITKTVDGTAYNYHYLGDQLVELTWDGNKLHFTYDSTGPLSVNCNGTEYFYVKNAQGDVTGLVNASGTRVVTYTYDAWGNILSQSGSMASTNPLRYRGYYYDSETGFYYLQSRYYDPATRRFINADVYSSTDSSDAVSCNMFAYCGNNPTSRSDETGDFWNFIVGAVVGAVVNAVSTAVDAVKEGGLDALSDGKTWAKIGVSAAGGLVSGALAASGVGLGASILGNTAISMAQNAANQAIDNGGLKSFDVGDMVIDGFIGGISAIPGGKGMKNTVKLDTLNKRLTKKLFSGSAQVAKQGIKYYYSQTKTLYKEYLIKPILKSAATAKILSSIT